MLSEKLERWIEAFRTNHCSCCGRCNCGRRFINSSGGWNFDEGEVEKEIRYGATDLDYSVTFLLFDGDEYVQDCDCWHSRAKTIMSFLDGNRDGIVKYLNGERDAALKIAKSMTEVKGD